MAGLMASGCMVAPPALRATGFLPVSALDSGLRSYGGTVCIFPRRAISFIEAGREKLTCSVVPGINSTLDFD